MAQPLTTDNVNQIIQAALKRNFDGIRTQLDGMKIEMKVLREEVKKISWDVENLKERFDTLPS